MSDTPEGKVYVTVGIDPEYEQPYANKASGPDDGDGPHSFTFPVDTELWDRYESTLNAWQTAMDDLIAATPLDPETGRLTECCPAWQGSMIAGHTGFRVILAASGNEEEWPLRDHSLAYKKTRAGAQAIIDVLPEEFYVHLVGEHFQKIRRDALSIQEYQDRTYATECERCGWSRTDHPNAGEPVVIDMTQDDAEDGGGEEE